MSSVLHPTPTPSAWRQRAVRVVEELFSVTPTTAWDDLLDLRQAILHDSRWNRTLDHFLRCRQRFEKDHYLPFYRLRKLLENHLRLTDPSAGGPPLRLNLWKHRCFADLCRRAQAQQLPSRPSVDLGLQVVEA